MLCIFRVFGVNPSIGLNILPGGGQLVYSVMVSNKLSFGGESMVITM
jgi:hypothetical protein